MEKNLETDHSPDDMRINESGMPYVEAVLTAEWVTAGADERRQAVVDAANVEGVIGGVSSEAEVVVDAGDAEAVEKLNLRILPNELVGLTRRWGLAVNIPTSPVWRTGSL